MHRWSNLPEVAGPRVGFFYCEHTLLSCMHLITRGIRQLRLGQVPWSGRTGARKMHGNGGSACACEFLLAARPVLQTRRLDRVKILWRARRLPVR